MLGDKRQTLLLLRQKPDGHGYGPLSLLPAQPGGEGLDEAQLAEPPERTLSLAIVVRPRSGVQKGLETVLPFWRRLFDECRVPLDELPAPPAEFAHGLELLRRVEPQGQLV